MPSSMSIEQAGGFPSGGNFLCQVYMNGTLIDATYQVTGAASNAVTGQTLYTGQSLQAVFSNCNPGVTASFNVYGTRQVP